MSRARDIASDPMLAFIQRPAPYAVLLLAQVSTLWCAFYLAWGAAGLVEQPQQAGGATADF